MPPDDPDNAEGPTLAFAWTGLELHAAGAAALRVRIAPSGSDGMSVRPRTTPAASC